jgi:hypothetical protein
MIALRRNIITDTLPAGDLTVLSTLMQQVLTAHVRT